MCNLTSPSPNLSRTRWLYICYDTNQPYQPYQPSQPFFLLCGHSFLLRFKVLSQSSLHSRSTFSLSLSLSLSNSPPALFFVIGSFQKIHVSSISPAKALVA